MGDILVSFVIMVGSLRTPATDCLDQFMEKINPRTEIAPVEHPVQCEDGGCFGNVMNVASQ